jgi:hypothetical protein
VGQSIGAGEREGEEWPGGRRWKGRGGGEEEEEKMDEVDGAAPVLFSAFAFACVSSTRQWEKEASGAVDFLFHEPFFGPLRVDLRAHFRWAVKEKKIVFGIAYLYIIYAPTEFLIERSKKIVSSHATWCFVRAYFRKLYM